MPLYIDVQVSPNGGTGESAFEALTSFVDAGAFSFDHTPVSPGQLYIYRARRRDSDTGQVSAWTVAVARAASKRTTQMPAGQLEINDVSVGSDERLGVGLEAFEGQPAKATALLEFTSFSATRDSARRTSRAKNNRSTIRRTSVRGRNTVTFSGTIEVRPEGGFPILVQSAMKLSQTDVLAGPTRYRHVLKNQKQPRPVTIIHQRTIGGVVVYFVYPGCKINSMQLVPDLSGDDVQMVTIEGVATDELILSVAEVAAAATYLGMDTAVSDMLDPYAAEDAIITIAGSEGELDTANFSLTNNFTPYRSYNGKRGVKGHVFKNGDPSASFTGFFADMDLLYADLGYDTKPNGAFGPSDCIVYKRVEAIWTPPLCGATFSNVMGIIIPHGDVKTSETANESDETKQNITVIPHDPVGNSDGTDILFYIVNSITGAEIAANARMVDPVNLPLSASHSYTAGRAQATSTTINIIAGATNPHLSGSDDTYNGAYLRFTSGALAGQQRIINDFTGATKTFITAAFASAPATGDDFVIVKSA